MAYIARIVVALNPDGTHKGSAVYEAETVGGKVYDLDPRPIASGDASALVAVMSSAQTAALATIDAQAAALTAATADKQAAEAARDAALARVAELEAQLAAPVAEVSMAQARIALHRAGKLDLIPAIIASLDEPPRIEAGIWWEFATTVRKEHPIVQMLAPALGLDNAALDDLFAVAASV
jgi:hypothetical protein